MGGGSLRRVVINGTSSPKSVTCVNNVMYESFGNNTFQLPSPSNVPVGTRIGIEQFSGTASVSCGTYNQTLSADTPDSSYDSQPAANAISYIFECVLDSSGTTREWILDIDHNYAAAVTTMVDRIIDVEEALAANSAADEVLTSRVSGLEGVASSLRNKDAEHDSAIDTLEVADNNIHGEFINQIARQTKHLNYAVTTSGKMVLTTESPTQNIKNDPSQMKTWLANNPSTLFYYDLIISVMTTNGTVVLPSAGVPTGARVTVELYTNYTVTVSDGTNSESFTNNESDNALLVLDFEYTKTGSSSTGWTLLSLV